ncbi:hypothetical protein [Myxococcus stipitatus]|uniref:nSTAND1 domain-containing NTPase n=1 Tax=Myxococcus stipitatus TaxID=83455 RepID=UPI0030D17517
MTPGLTKLRQLAAGYWSPFVHATLLVAGVFGVKDVDLSNLETVSNTLWIVLGAGLFVLALIRFPRVSFWITRLLLPPPPPFVPNKGVFRGPSSYSREDSAEFKGRAPDATACLQEIQRKPFFILEGESGCGKSSLLNVSLLPVAEQQFKVVQCRMGQDSFGRLGAALLGRPYVRGEAPWGPERLDKSISGACRANTQANGKPLLLCLDQFEEIFLRVPEVSRLEFWKSLMRAIKGGGLRVLISVRSDFLDLLLKDCHAVDPAQDTLDLGSYYTLKAFRHDQARGVLHEMLAPRHGDALIKQQMEDFAEALCRELLRPPRDRRLSRDEEPTILPVELQILGQVMEAAGGEHLSRTALRRLGGKPGLLRMYLERAKNDVRRTTMLPGEKTFQILGGLVTDAGTKRSRAPVEFAKSLSLPIPTLLRALEELEKKSLVKKVLLAEELSGDPAGETGYELMHDHLAAVLAEAPDPHLQRVRDAEARLDFWLARFHMALRSPNQTFWQAGRIALTKPLPMIEAVLLARYARNSQERRMLRHNHRAVALRCVAVCVPLGLGLLLTRMDRYQVWMARRAAPVESAFKAGAFQPIGSWAAALVHLGYLDDAERVISQAEAQASSSVNPNTRARVRQDLAVAYVAYSEALAKTGRKKEAANAAIKARSLFESADPRPDFPFFSNQISRGAVPLMLRCAGALVDADLPEEAAALWGNALRLTEGFDDGTIRKMREGISLLFVRIAADILKKVRPNTFEQIVGPSLSEVPLGRIIIAVALDELKQISSANSAWSTALKDVSPTNRRMVLEALGQAGRVDLALAFAQSGDADRIQLEYAWLGEALSAETHTRDVSVLKVATHMKPTEIPHNSAAIMARALARVRQVKEAQPYIDRALKADGSLDANGRTAVVEALALIGDELRATQVAGMNSELQARIAGSLVSMGACGNAQRMVAEIEDAQQKLWVLLTVARQCRTRQPDEASRAATEALALARNMADQLLLRSFNSRDKVLEQAVAPLFRVASAMHETQDKKRALEALSYIVHKSESEEGREVQAVLVLERAADRLLLLGEADMAKAAWDLASAHVYRVKLSSLWLRVAQGFARTRSFYEARTAAENVDAAGQLGGYATLLIEYKRMQDGLGPDVENLLPEDW